MERYLLLAVILLAACGGGGVVPTTQPERPPSTVVQVVDVVRSNGRVVPCAVINQPQGVAIDCGW